jgi:hypothetical protein
MGAAWILAIAVLPAAEKASKPNPVAIEEFDYLEKTDIGGSALQTISATVSSRGVDYSGVSQVSRGSWRGSLPECPLAPQGLVPR